jgi:putative glycosyltransferase (TIGR04348 family)
MHLNIEIITPAPRHSRLGNRVTAERYAALLRELEHDVAVTTEFSGAQRDVIFALHARRVANSIQAAQGRAPLVLVLTGTDVYRDIHEFTSAQQSLEAANAIVTLQPLAINQLPARHRAKARAILQSTTAPNPLPGKSKRALDLCVVGHLRDEKDPLRAAAAARLLPADSRVRIIQAGGILDNRYKGELGKEEAANPRYRYMGELPHARVMRLIARSHALILTSRMEGGANVIGEACVSNTPVISSDIDGSRGVLGDDYPAYFKVGDTPALAKLMLRFERDAGFRKQLEALCRDLKPRFSPRAEQAALAQLLHEVTTPRPSS